MSSNKFCETKFYLENIPQTENKNSQSINIIDGPFQLHLNSIIQPYKCVELTIADFINKLLKIDKNKSELRLYGDVLFFYSITQNYRKTKRLKNGFQILNPTCKQFSIPGDLNIIREIIRKQVLKTAEGITVNRGKKYSPNVYCKDLGQVINQIKEILNCVAFERMKTNQLRLPYFNAQQ